MDKDFKQSTLARKFLKWYELEHNLLLRTSETAGYEKRIQQYSVDGFVEAKNRPNHDRDLIVEVHGCYW
jgi:hypothetical protein